MSRAFMPSQHYDDFTLSSTGDDYHDQHAIHGAQQPHPLKSTLPTQYRSSQGISDRPALPRGWSNTSENMPQILQRDFARNTGAEEDVTLSTDLGTEADEYLGPSRPERQRTTTLYEDDSYIPGVGRGHHQRQGGNGASSYSAHRDLLVSSNLPVHPSPGTAARHEQLRRSTTRSQPLNKQRLSPLSSSTASDGEDSESGIESSRTSTTSFAMQPKGLMQSKAESTGNHNAYTATLPNQSPALAHFDRPKLDSRALDAMDKAVKKGKAAMRQNLPHSPSPDPSRRDLPRGSGVIRSRKEDRGNYSKQDGTRRPHQQVAEGSNGSSGSGDARKPSDGSSNGRKQAGTAGSTTGETLVEEVQRDYLRCAASGLQAGQRSPFIKLPSGQKMGQGVYADSAVFLPDITGMTSALESPAKAILGVEHREMRPEVIQAKHLQTNETRLDEFNDLAHYVKSVEKNLDQTQKKVKAVEQTSLKCAKEVDELREEWSSWREVKSKRTTRQDDAKEGEEGDDYEEKVKAINEHIAQLTHDLHSYRNTMEQMRMDKIEKERAYQQMIKAKQHRQAERKRLASIHQVMSSSPIKQSKIEDEDEATRLEMIALRRQVYKVAKEVERLRDIVDGEGVKYEVPSKTTKSARFAASVPAPAARRDIGVGSQSSFVKPRLDGMRSSSLDNTYGHVRQSSELDEMRGRNSSPPPSVRGFNEDLEGDLSEIDEGDETARPVEEANLHASLREEDEEDVSIMAQSRAQKTFETIKERGITHDEKHCTVCLSKARSEKKRQVRKAKVSRQVGVSYSEDQDEDERILLSLLDSAAANQESLSMPKKSSAKHQAIIQRLLKEHMDEFYHHRLLYCELADELKHVTPDMSRVKRKILAEHVMEAVEGLELRARRINMLQGLTSERKSNDAKQRQRYNATSVDGGDLYRRVVSA